MEGMPARGASAAWLQLGGRLGRVGAGCLVAQNFLYILAPLFFLLDLEHLVNPRDAGGQFVAQASDAGLFLAIGDLTGLLGFSLVASALAAILTGVEVSRKPPSIAVMAIGATAFACTAVMPLVMAWAEGKPRELGVGSVAAATFAGGWGVGSAVLLVGSIALLAFALIRGRLRDRRLACPWWVAFSGVVCMGVAPLVSLIQAAGETDHNPYTMTISLALRILVLPVLAILAYRELAERLPWWGPIVAGTKPRQASPRRRPHVRELPPPPPPEFDPMPLPPPPSPE